MTEKHDRKNSASSRRISRRRFLRMTAATAATLASGCRTIQGSTSTPTSPPTQAAVAAPTVAPTTVPPTTTATATITTTATAPPTAASTTTATAPPTAASTATATAPPTAAATATATAPPTTALSRVAIAQADTYDRTLIRRQVQALLDDLGGLDDVIRPGGRVAIKTNLTGGAYFGPPAGMSAIESYMTHPEVVRALGELLRDAGARELFIVEALFTKDSYTLFGYDEVAQGLNATLIDLNDPDPYGDFASTPVGEGWSLIESFAFNHILEEVDAFISVAKMKCHYNAGVTHAMKNLVGLVPVSHYRLDEEHWWRSALHATSTAGLDTEPGTRLPRVILDLNRARPIHLALIDGVKTGEGGEVPRGSFKPVQPGVLVAGKNPVATDAVATAVMGFDPTARPFSAPFLRADNYLNMAYALGMGTNRLEEIAVVGASIDDVRYEFQPAQTM